MFFFDISTDVQHTQVAMNKTIIAGVLGVVVIIGGIVLWQGTQNRTQNTNSSSSNSISNSSQGISVGEPNSSQPVKIVSACEKLTQAEVLGVYPNRTFEIRNKSDNATIYEALSQCQYVQTSDEFINQYTVNLQIRAQPSAAEAKKFFDNIVSLDSDNKGKNVSSVGDMAYYSNFAMLSGGPRLEFVKDNVYYRLNVTILKAGATGTIENEILSLAKKTLE